MVIVHDVWQFVNCLPYISEQHILSLPIFVSLRSFAEARLRIYMYVVANWRVGTSSES